MMKQRVLLLVLYLACTLTTFGQVPVTRGGNKPKTLQNQSRKANNNFAKKPQRKNTGGNKGQSIPTAYDVTFSCNVESATLFIDGNNNGTPSGTRTLKTGSHTVNISADGYYDYFESIKVDANNKTFHFTLKEIVRPNKTFTVNGVSFTMVYVQGGTFQMGATSEQGIDAYDDEKPAHSVTLSNYYIGETEVTQELWKAVMGSNPSQFQGPNNPVEQVSWDDCQTFINKLNSLTGQRFHLPTEAQWEYAARGGNNSRGYKHSGSKTLSEVAWYTNNSGASTHPVKAKIPNELGLYDMSGNVWEWCQDWYGSYSGESLTNPTGPSSGPIRVRRGGSWYNNARNCRVSDRYHISSDIRDNIRYYSIGLRLAL